ncbi:diguanylate cyclase domain-containing protein [Thalassotalea sp. PLHSN55]|uniref:diguanylate cyclase domain-containing protein n=1 Tax=Thalassotalea sp. PLHSN55 TaxID=3435888 RepID=UPI003F8764D4
MKSEYSQLEDSIYRLFEVTPVPMILSYPDGKFEYVNPALCKMLGYEGDSIYADEVIITHADDIEVNKEIRSHLKKAPFTPIKIEKRYKHKLGHTIYAQLNIVAQADPNGTIKRYVSQIIDLTAIKKSDAAEILLNQLVNQSNDAIYVIDGKFGRILNCNDLAFTRLGYTKAELLSMKVSDINHNFDDQQRWQTHVERMKKVGNILIESSHTRKDGTEFPIEVNVSIQEYNNASYLLAIARDISKRKQKEIETYQRLNLDPLTNLPNRRVLNEKLKRLEQEKQRKKCYTAFVYIDLDNFKQLNDTHGHTVGDSVLVQTAKRLKNCIRESDIISRLGGDEFLVVMCNLDSQHLVKRMATKLEQEFNSPYKIQKKLLTVEASIGVAVHFEGDLSTKTQIQLADKAMYKAKEQAGLSIYYGDELS